MSRAYVLDRDTLDVVGLLEQSYERLRYVRRYWAMDTFELLISRARLYASEIQRGRVLFLPDEGDRAFLVEQIEAHAESAVPADTMKVSGRSLEGIALAERLAIPVGTAYDEQTAVPAETAMKHYVDEHAGPSATLERQVPGLVIAADAAQGATVTMAARFQPVMDVLREIGLVSGMGFEITLDKDAGTYVFDVVVGQDRTADVVFDFTFATLNQWERLESLLDSKTWALVAGQGEGVDRELVTRPADEPEGFDRREAFVDARDVEPGNTALLQARGDAFLAAAGPEDRFEARVHHHGAFRYREHWDLGDIVTVRDTGRDVEATMRVVEVTVEYRESAALPEIMCALDRPFPTIREKAGATSSSAPAVRADIVPSAHDHAHGDLTGVTADQHHGQSHGHTGADGSGTVAHANLTGVTANQHHNQAHAISGADHTGTIAAAQYGVENLNGLSFTTPAGAATNWAGLGAGYGACVYWKDPFGVVHLEGVASRSSGASTIIGTLPAGYRPSAKKRCATGAWPGAGDVLLGILDIHTDGSINLIQGGASAVSLDSITFRV